MDVLTRHMSGLGKMQRREKIMTGFTTTSRELSLHEMLADPIVQTVMARDGVTKQDVEALIETVRDKLVGRPAEHLTGDEHPTGER
jgi:hypothetical protein